jgi:hypothetical protein
LQNQCHSYEGAGQLLLHACFPECIAVAFRCWAMSLYSGVRSPALASCSGQTHSHRCPVRVRRDLACPRGCALSLMYTTVMSAALSCTSSHVAVRLLFKTSLSHMAYDT